MLEPLGLSPAEESAYVALLAEPLLTTREVAERVRCTERTARTLLTSLQDRALTSRAHGSPARYVAAPPETALADLVAERRRELDRVSRYGLELSARHQQATRPPLELVQFTSGPDEVLRQDVVMQTGAQREVLICDRPPYLVASNPMQNQVQMEAMARGVRYRCIYHQPSLELPGRMNRVRRYIEGGEEARVHRDLPVKMLVVDRTTALVICDLREDTYHRALMVREESLLAALLVCFESLWERSVPLGGTRSPDPDRGTPDADDRAVLTLLNAGLKDAAIAEQLGLSRRTVLRRVESLMSRLGTVSRFQAGAEAVRRRWL